MGRIFPVPSCCSFAVCKQTIVWHFSPNTQCLLSQKQLGYHCSFGLEGTHELIWVQQEPCLPTGVKKKAMQQFGDKIMPVLRLIMPCVRDPGHLTVMLILCSLSDHKCCYVASVYIPIIICTALYPLCKSIVISLVLKVFCIQVLLNSVVFFSCRVWLF